jgi:three-Cys-motif partner protein
VDAFAGTGYRQPHRKEKGWPDIFEEISDAETQEFLKGSAKLALEVIPPFHRYVFVESDAAKVAELERLREEHPDRAPNVIIIQDDANTYVQQFCQTMHPQERAVVFLDPFATEVEWSTIEAIAKTHAIDVWILFPLMAVNRLVANDPNKALRGHLDRIFGTEAWFESFYRTRREEDIFGQSYAIIEKACSFDGIGKFYLERLRSIFAAVAEKPRVLQNSRAPLFQFFFAAGNEKGAPIAVKIANHLLEKL